VPEALSETSKLVNKLITIGQVMQLCGFGAAMRVLFAKLFRRETVQLVLKQGDVSATCRLNNSDLVIFIGTFLHGDCRISMSPEPRAILDLGANAGLTALQLRRQFPRARLIMVEPGHENCLICQRNTAHLADSVLVNAVVSNKAGWFTLGDARNIAMSQWYKESSKDDTRAVRSLRVGQIIAEYAEGLRPVLVKMDIEQAEREIFLSDCSWLADVDAVLVEPHGEGTKDVIERSFRAHEFVVGQVGEKVLGHRKQMQMNERAL
jgi:FkbM family methyltransferase